jgi:hypothetical protein
LYSAIPSKTLHKKARIYQEIAKELGLSTSSFYRKRNKKNLVIPIGVVTPLWQKIIYEAFWYPDEATKKELEILTNPDKDGPLT